MSRSALALLVALAAPALAQPAPGFVVTAAGDTLRGEVLLVPEAEYARGVTFRPAAGAAPVRYGPADAVAFEVGDGRRYRRGLFQVRAVREADPMTPNDRLAFARVVRDGTADLLALEVVEGRPVYYVQTDGDLVGLYLFETEVGGGVRRSRPLYRQTLLTVLGTCGTSEATYAELDYTEPDLARTVDAYNSCHDASYVVRTDGGAVRRATTVAFEVGADVSAGSFRRRGLRATSRVDPAAQASRLRFAAEVASPLLPRYARLVLGAEYAHDVARVQRYQTPLQLNTIHAALGLRVAGRVGGLDAHVGTGLMVGTVLDRKVEAGPPGTAVWAVPPGSTESSGGQYVEAGIRVPRTPLVLTVRGEATSFSSGPVFVPFASGSSLGTRTVSAGLSARL